MMIIMMIIVMVMIVLTAISLIIFLSPPHNPLFSLSTAQHSPVVFGNIAFSTTRMELSSLPPESKTALLQAIRDICPVKVLEKDGVLHWHPEAPKMVALKASREEEKEHGHVDDDDG